MRIVLLASLLLSQACAMAADGLTPAQQHMRACNTQAKEKGLEARARSRFITDCLNGRNGERPLTPLQARNEACTRKADEEKLQGAARRGFMSDCTKPDRVKQETPQHVKMENCTRRADKRRLAGDDRRKFVDSCLEGSRTAVDG